MVVVPVDQGQLHHGVVAQLGRQAQGDVQPGVARPGDHDPAAPPGGGCAHGVLQVMLSERSGCGTDRLGGRLDELQDRICVGERAQHEYGLAGSGNSRMLQPSTR